MSSTSPTPGAFSLFPSPSSSTPPITVGQASRPRRSESRERRARTPQSARTRTPQPGELSLATSPPRSNGRKTPQLQAQSPSSQQQPQQSPPRQRQRQGSVSREQQMQSPAREHQQQPREQQTQSPAREQRELPPLPREQTPVAAEQPQAQHPLQQHPSRLVRNPDRSSIAKPPLEEEAGSSGQVRSIFPTYNPNIPLNQQNYAPTQLGPAGIPRAIISRQSFFPNDDSEGINQEEPPLPVTTRSPLRGGSEDDPRWGHAVPLPRDPPVEPQTCTTSQLKSFWRVANGWRATPLEGRVYCMKLEQEKDAPVYTLSSSTQPFYNIRIDPTSASAYVTVKRHDPNKPYKDPTGDSSPISGSSLLSAVSGGSNSSPRSSKITDGKHWSEALTTTLEEESRRHRPNDGLVALLMPRAAAKMALEKANDPQAVYMAERECARLVWDDDSASHFLVHPALATPFCVTIDRSPAWSRVEYTLEHHESPQHLAKLTRDGTGAGWLEFDTGLASKIESCYIADVAITALILVASADEKNQPVAETFEPPPVLPPPQTLFLKSNSSREKVFGKAFGGKKNKGPVEVFELDLESQSSSLGKDKKKKKDTKVKEGLDKLPFVLRVPAKLARWAFKALIWIFTQIFGCLKAMFCCCYGVVGSKY
ncbi:unnamed protein product [Clonostachys rhizophaga]|uniref:Acetylserotonin methytransferase-like protein n=1 Tax=Clonostachys rhizophaga TaxID=160324 RepID=A0A9N9YEQ4_9HYPO|nr:unnamed protein product [Clonostachys rhizophaga]